MPYFHLLAITCFVILGACAPRGIVQIDRDAAPEGNVHPVFVATSRAPDPERRFAAERSAALGFARYDVSVPPGHVTGRIEWPSGAAIAGEDFFATEGLRYSSGTGFRSALRDALMERPRGERIVVLYVHGFNNTFADGIYRLAQMSEDFDLPGVAVHYSWPSAGNPLGYGYDRDSVLFARDGMEDLLRIVSRAGAEEVLLVAHSLGGLLSMETMRQMEIARPGSARRTVSGVVLISPDIDVDVFRRQASRIGKLPQPFAIFASERDRALRLSARLTGQSDRLGTLTDAGKLSDLEITIFDVTEFSDGPIGHFNAATSPALIRILRLLPGIEAAFTNDRAGRAGLLPGTILTVQNATQIVLSPIAPR